MRIVRKALILSPHPELVEGRRAKGEGGRGFLFFGKQPHAQYTDTALGCQFATDWGFENGRQRSAVAVGRGYTMSKNGVETRRDRST